LLSNQYDNSKFLTSVDWWCNGYGVRLAVRVMLGNYEHLLWYL